MREETLNLPVGLQDLCSLNLFYLYLIILKLNQNKLEYISNMFTVPFTQCC